MNGLVFDPIIAPAFIWALGLLLAAATGWVYFTAGARLSRARNGTLLALRLLGVAGLLALLFQPSRREELPERRTAKVLLAGLDRSRSMNQQDAGHLSRFDAAKTALRDAKLLEAGPRPPRLFLFDADAAPVSPEALEAAKAEGATTRLHHSVEAMINALPTTEKASALVLLTDGHDFDLVNPAKTAALARARHVPIYAVPLGEQGTVRDVSAAITNFEPYSYAKQKAHLSASLRLIGCEHETLTIQLLRKGQVVQTQQTNARELRELPVDFEVTEPEAGQYEYEIRALPLPREADTHNNSAITFLNVIDQRIRVLLLEGAPYWDTTFLRRSLGQNDKIELEAILQYTADKARRIHSGGAPGRKEEPAAPVTQEQFNAYDVIVLGKAVDSFFTPERYAMLVSFVKEHGGTVIFSRGPAFKGALAKEGELEPIQWSDHARTRTHFQVSREGALLSPFRVLAENNGGVEGLPELLAARQSGDRKALSALLAQAHDPESAAESPAMVHRRVGRGQVLSVAVDGLWRWSFNPKAAATNNVFDRFWDQLVVWLVAGADAMPNRQFSLRTSTSNLVLGAKMHFRLSVRDTAKAPKEVPVTIYEGDKEVARLALAPTDRDDPTHLTGDYLPERTGRFRAVAALPGAEKQEVKWMVFDENPEEKEVTADVPYLTALCEGTGGKVLLPGELATLAKGLQQHEETGLAKVRLTSAWDQPWVFYIICAAFGLDWYLRRKWGLC